MSASDQALASGRIMFVKIELRKKHVEGKAKKKDGNLKKERLTIQKAL
jgi:hypothetical protein